MRAPGWAALYPPGVELVVDVVPVGVVLVLVVVVVPVVVLVDDGVVLCVLVPVVPVPLGVLDVPDEGVVLVLDGVEVPGAGVVVEDVGLALVEVLLELGGLASRPLLLSVESISCCTAATDEATALGVPPAPSAGSAFSCLSSPSSVFSSCWEGFALSVITSWSASAVVVQAGQL